MNQDELGTYKNGNYRVNIYKDGTKIRFTLDDSFKPKFAENIDLKITNKCTGAGCEYCHEGSCPNGKHAVLDDPFFYDFIDSLQPFTELAIGGGNVLEHPNLIDLLQQLKNKNIIANITVNQIHLMRNLPLIRMLEDLDLIHGLGVSLKTVDQGFIKEIKSHKNAVIHVINGIITKDQWEALCDKDLKVLILGYKELRRGETYIESHKEEVEKNKKYTYDNLPEFCSKFKVLSFDNLAIEQLDVRRLLSEEEWDQFYMGDDGNFTYYIDVVNRQFALSSTAPMNERYPMIADSRKMFQMVLEKGGKYDLS